MKVPFLDLKKINAEIETEIIQAVNEVVKSGWYILGKAGELFEQNLKQSLIGDAEGYAVGCNSGTDALILSLLAAGVQAGDEVITVSHTAIPTVSAICAVNAIPVFVDIDEHTWLMDTAQVAGAVTPRTKAIIAVHLYGNMVDVNRLRQELSSVGREDVSIIEDVAQGHGAIIGNSQAGTLGRFGAFSFYPSKNIGALGDGGAVFCRNVTDYEKLKMLRNYGQKDRYHSELKRGLNSRLDEIQAAILSRKLSRLTEWNSRKSLIVARFHQELTTLPLQFQYITEGCRPAWHLCVIAVRDRDTRDSLMSHLDGSGVQTLIHYPIPNHLQKAFRPTPLPTLPVTVELAGRILSLPLNQVLTIEEQQHVISSVQSYWC